MGGAFSKRATYMASFPCSLPLLMPHAFRCCEYHTIHSLLPRYTAIVGADSCANRKSFFHTNTRNAIKVLCEKHILRDTLHILQY